VNLRITISDYLDNGECELSGTTGECVVLANGDEPAMTILGKELLKYIRFEKKKAEKRENGQKPSRSNSAT
jgi:hypothetical protein